jgi:hypothetical protein
MTQEKMLRRSFLVAGAGAAVALAQQKADDAKPEEVHVAGATQDPTPRVGIVLSSFKEGEEHDGTKISGLTDPQPPGAALTGAQFDAWVRKAIDLAALKHSEVFEVIEPEDWIVVKTRSRTDARIVGLAIAYLAEHQRGSRFTIVDRLAQAGDWGQEYRKLVSDLGGKFPKARFELVDLKSAATADIPVADKPGVKYEIPKIIQQCDRLISVAPLATDPATGVSLSVGSYAAFSSKPVATDEALIDLFSYRPADLALVGGRLGYEVGDEVHHNVLISGMKAIAVDSVAASVMGFKPADLPYLALGEKRGFGSWDPDEIWTRGNEIEEARREFKKPAGWHKG